MIWSFFGRPRHLRFNMINIVSFSFSFDNPHWKKLKFTTLLVEMKIDNATIVNDQRVLISRFLDAFHHFDDLIATVERTETSFRLDPEQESKLAYWYAVAQSEVANMNYELAGVA